MAAFFSSASCSVRTSPTIASIVSLSLILSLFFFMLLKGQQRNFRMYSPIPFREIVYCRCIVLYYDHCLKTTVYRYTSTNIVIIIRFFHLGVNNLGFKIKSFFSSYRFIFYSLRLFIYVEKQFFSCFKAVSFVG